MFFNLLKYLSYKEICQLVIGSIAYKVFQLTPRYLFHFRNFIESLSLNNYSYQVKSSEIIVENNQALKFALRKRSSDLLVFDQIFINEEFKNVVDLIKLRSIRIETILDAGANIGLATLYLKTTFPESQILSIEPDSNNQIQFDKNMKINRLDNIELIKGGIWNSNGFLTMDYSFRDGLEWSRSLKLSESEPGNIQVFTVNELLKRKNWASVDFLKIDIEGAEKNIFSQPDTMDYLRNIKVITVEIHHLFDVGHLIINTLVQYNFEIFLSGELVIGVKK